MPNTSTVADSVSVSVAATLVERAKAEFTAFYAATETRKEKLTILVALFNGLTGYEEKEALKQAAFVEPRKARGVTADSIKSMWTRFVDDAKDAGLDLVTWWGTKGTVGAVKKREQRKNAAATKPQAVLEAEAKLKAEREKAEAAAKAQREARRKVKDDLMEAIKKMSDQELKKLLHFAIKMMEATATAKPAAK